MEAASKANQQAIIKDLKKDLVNFLQQWNENGV
jgi:hypothetical protein